MITYIVAVAAALLGAVLGMVLSNRIQLPDIERRLRADFIAHFKLWGKEMERHAAEVVSGHATALKDEIASHVTNLSAEVYRQGAESRIALQKALHERVDAALEDVEPRLLETLKVQFREAMEKAVKDMGEDVSEADKARFMNAFHW